MPSPAALRQVLRQAPMSAALCAVQVAAFLALAARSGWWPDEASLVAAGALERGRVWAGQPWRLLTAALLHASPVHLGANVLFGWGWYRLVEGVVGPRRLLALWVASAVGASATSLLAQDVVSVGASGALLGVIGATLALHRRALPGWADFLRSPAVVQLALSLGVYTAVALLAGLPIDHAAHAGGLVTGAAAAWLLSRPPPRRAALAAGAAALLLAGVAACWPRPGPTAWRLAEARQALLEALRREDLPAAGAAAAPLEATGWRGRGDALLHALLLEARGELDAAEPALRALLGPGGDPAIRATAARLLFRIGYRRYTGEGAPKDPERAYLAIRDACQAGDEEACRAERQIRTGRVVPDR